MLANKKIEKALVNFVADFDMDMAFYGEFFLFIEFFREDSVKTAGVNFQNNKMNLYYNEEFVNKLRKKQLNFLLIHEIYHLLLDHCTIGRSGGFKHDLANIAQDMIINDDILTNISDKFVEMPKEGITMHKDYKGIKVFEPLYAWLENRKEELQEEFGKGGDKEGEEPEYDLDKMLLANGKGYEFDKHMDLDGVPEELKNEIVKDVLDNLKNRGLISSNMQQTIDKLRTKKDNILKKILKNVAELKGITKEKSYRKINRRGLPTKGKISKCASINCVLDTSGSMSGDFEKVLAYIFRDDIVINLIQCDTEVKKVSAVKSKRQLQKESIVGLGGTTIQPSLDLIAEKYNKLPTLILTDGETDQLNFSKIAKKTIILSTSSHCPISVDNGKIFQHIIETK